MRLFFIFLFFCSVQCYAQDTLKLQTCSGNYSVTNIADSLQHLYTAQGFSILKVNTVQMESGYELPVIVPLTQGTWYHFIFIANPGARFMELRMYDWNEKQVVYQKQYGDIELPLISFSYIPRFSEYYMLKPVQLHAKKKALCGVLMMFKKNAPK